MFRRIALLGLLIAVAQPSFAETWEIDGSHSNVGFKVRHMTVTWVRGQFSDVKGALKIDDADLAKMEAEATIGAASVNTQDKKRDDHLRNPDFFDVTKYPSIKFKSKRVTKDETGNLKLVGDLTIRDKTKEVTLNTSVTPAVKDPWGNMKRGLSATTQINRKDFGVSWNKSLDAGGLVVGDEVDVNIDLELISVAAKPAKGKAEKKG